MNLFSEKASPKTCQLCGKTDNTVDTWIGGYVTYAHHKCAKIANIGLHLYFQFLLKSLNGAEVLRQQLNQADKELEEQRKLLEARVG